MTSKSLKQKVLAPLLYVMDKNQEVKQFIDIWIKEQHVDKKTVYKMINLLNPFSGMRMQLEGYENDLIIDYKNRTCTIREFLKNDKIINF